MADVKYTPCHVDASLYLRDVYYWESVHIVTVSSCEHDVVAGSDYDSSDWASVAVEVASA